MRLVCPAKINLHLRVGRRRPDGFHPLLSWMTTVGLFDTLTVEDQQLLPPGTGGAHTHGVQPPVAAAPPGEPVAGEAALGNGPGGAARREDGLPPGRERAGAARILLLSSDLPGLPDDGSNLVVRAAEALAHAIAGSGAGDLRDDAAGPSGGGRRAGAKSGSVTPQPRAATPAPGSSSSSSSMTKATGGGNAVGGVREGVDTPNTTGQGQTRHDGEAVARVRPVAARLGKQIPLGAGLGGGSSDAARTLIGLNRFWNANRSPDELAPIAAQLGSDVPFFLHGPSSVCTGRGEVVKPVSPPRPRWAVLVLPDIHMPTAAVYRRFDEMNLGFDEFIDEQPNWEHWSTRNAKDFLAGVVNDLEAPAFQIRPDLGTLRADTELKLVRPVRMSGSGSSLFTLFDEDPDEAHAAARDISRQFQNVRALAVEMAPMLNDDAA